MLIDSHAHLDFPDFKDDIEEVIQRAKNAGVEKIINIGADLDLSEKAIKIAESHDNIWATVGVHAEYADDHELGDLKEEIKKLAKSSEKVVAIGECGPDYYWNDQNKYKQLKLFELQLELAKELDLPLVAHIRNGMDECAAENAYDLLQKTGVKRGVVHCFTLEKRWVERYVNLGFYIGFTGIVTYKNAENVRESAKAVPLERLLVETDAPYLSPQSVRSLRNEPSYVVEVAEKLAEVKGVTLSEIERITTENAEALFLKSAIDKGKNRL
jgi:TatD DNase family protein